MFVIDSVGCGVWGGGCGVRGAGCELRVEGWCTCTADSPAAGAAPEGPWMARGRGVAGGGEGAAQEAASAASKGS